MSMRLLTGDCRAVLPTLPENSVDAIVCDPPYELTSARPGGRSEATRGAVMGGFMGMRWDGTGVAFDPATWAAALRVLKPGGHLLAFGGTRTFHRIACAIEDAGFELRDTVLNLHERDCPWLMAWCYGSGFPKSLDVSKAIDKAAGAERERYARPAFGGTFSDDNGSTYGTAIGNDPATDAARQWQGWGTALKPAFEPIVVARKPLVGTVAMNVLLHGTGAINIDGCRIETDEQLQGSTVRDDIRGGAFAAGHKPNPGDIPPYVQNGMGRWPANVIHDGSDEVLAAFPTDSKLGTGVVKVSAGGAGRTVSGSMNPSGMNVAGKINVGARDFGDSGSAARFFKQCAPDCWLCDGQKGDSSTCPAVNPVVKVSSRSVPGSDSVRGPALAPQLHDSADNIRSNLNSVRSAEWSLNNGSATIASIAQPSAGTMLDEKFVQRVQSVGNLCDSCAIAIAQNLAALPQGLDVDLPHGWGSINERKKQILIQSLALFVESLGNTGITPTTASLNLWFGYVRNAIDENIRQESLSLSGEFAPARFRYQGKATREDRNEGCEGLDEQPLLWSSGTQNPGSFQAEGTHRAAANNHPTVKPTSLMRWLVRLVTPPGGTVLDPFMGSGSTGKACELEGFDFIGIELDAAYVDIARRRIGAGMPLFREAV